MDKKELSLVKDTTKKLLGLLGIEDPFEIEENEEGLSIVIDTKDSGIVIGYHGETLDSLQLILALCISKKLGEFRRVSLEVGDYKKNRTETLENLALRTKERVLLEKREVTIPDLKSWERRIIHLALSNDKEVVSESVGVGRDRVLVVRPRA